MASYFHPLDEREHNRGCAGADVPDYCQNCRAPYATHTNGKCPVSRALLPHTFTPSEIHPDTCGVCGKYAAWRIHQ